MGIGNWNEIIYWTDQIVFLLFTIPVGYLLVFSMASLKKIRITYPKTKKQYKYAVIITARAELDRELLDSVDSFLLQDYPKDKYDIIVVNDNLSDLTIQDLQQKGVVFIDRKGGKSGRKWIIEDALIYLKPSIYDIVVIIKPNNTVDTDYLTEINKAYHSGGMAIQTHLISKNTKSNLTILNALTEEINNSIFRRGHVTLGFSSSLIGSGMVLNYSWLEKNITKLRSPGLTKQLEASLLKQGIYIEYLENVYTYDEKPKNVSTLKKQRENWSKARKYSLKDAIKDFPRSLFAGNLDFCDKIFQWIMPSRFLLLGFIILIALLLPMVEWTLALKWWILLGILLLSFSFSIPEKFINFRTFWALIMLPVVLITILFNRLCSKFRN